METCPHCLKQIPSDSSFCVHCGRSLVIIEDIEKENPRKNNWATLGLMLFLFALILLDFVLGSIVATIGFNEKFVFVISLIFYILAILCGIVHFIVNHRDKKQGYKQTGNMAIAMVAIVMSSYIALTNITMVLLK